MSSPAMNTELVLEAPPPGQRFWWWLHRRVGTSRHALGRHAQHWRARACFGSARILACDAPDHVALRSGEFATASNV